MAESVTVISSGGVLVTESGNNTGAPMTNVTGARPVTIGTGGPSVTFISVDGTLYPGGNPPGGPGGVGSPIGLLLSLTKAA
jgi:hypothetical protein